MIDRMQLLTDLKPLLRAMETDLRARCDEAPQINEDLTKEYEQARAANRVGITFEEWRAELITQVAVAWVLSCVFVRFLEDNDLISPSRISGPLHGTGNESGLTRARDERDLFFRSHPTLTDRDYLLSVFDDLAKLHGTKEVFGPYNPVNGFRDWLSGDAAQNLIGFFQKIDTDGTGEIIHDFTDEQWDTRFLGDLYQDLSEAARKKYALLQTPEFVEEFILERTLEPAIREFGLKDFKMIDPACGSGHFLLGSLNRILGHWRKEEPGTNERELVNRAIASINGVDLNPYAIAIARFRLLLVAMKECHITQIKNAPNFHFNLVCGDSLLHGVLHQIVFEYEELSHHYQSENIDELRRILNPGQYHAVVANPPYITAKDRVLNQAYRDRYRSVCYRKYSLSAPFMKRLFDLGCKGGFIGQITANSFMKREFGKKLIEHYLPTVDLTHVIDTAGAYIPGHGTPTVIIFGRHRKPVNDNIRTAMGIMGEPSTPVDPSKGLVWSAIIDQIDKSDSESIYVSVTDTPRLLFSKHPWSIGGGGAAELKNYLDEQAAEKLKEVVEEIGIFGITAADDAMMAARHDFQRRNVQNDIRRPLIIGDKIRDWFPALTEEVLFPYNSEGLISMVRNTGYYKWLWPVRTELWARATFSKQTYRDEGRTWWEWHQVTLNRLRTPLSIIFSFVATHNHFLLDRGGNIFNRSAPVIKLSSDKPENQHLRLIGALNSSVACFWLKQVAHNKGSTVDERGARQRTAPFEDFFEFTSTQLESFPLTTEGPNHIAREIDEMARGYSQLLPDAMVERGAITPHELNSARNAAEEILGRMIAFQEELDWLCYQLYGLIDNAPLYKTPPPVKLGERAFEIVLARKITAGEEDTTWFIRHNSLPTSTIPKGWPVEYEEVIQQRIKLINTNRNINLIERPEYKRRWNIESWEQQQKKALNKWLLNRLESYFDLDGRMNENKTITATENLQEIKLTNVAQLTDIVRKDTAFMQVAEFYTNRSDFDLVNFVGELIATESVPCLPILRFKPAGMDKHSAWQRAWNLQRLEDDIDALFDLKRLRKVEIQKAEGILRPQVSALAINENLKSQILDHVLKTATHVANAIKKGINPQTLVTEALKSAKKIAIGEIPVPPKYTSKDFLDSNFWKLRGKLDVPKERWVSFPYCEGEDGTMVIAWAGYDHLQLAQAIAERYEQAKELEGRKLVPLLACIGQLIPWLKQWHNDIDPIFGTRLGDYFEGYLAEEAKALEMTVAEVMAWKPPEQVRRRGRRRRNTTAV